MTGGQKNLIALGMGLCMSFAAGEGALRLYQWRVNHIPFFSIQPDYRPRARFRLSPFLVFGPRVDQRVELRRSRDSYFSAQGFRTHELLGPKPPGVVRVFALGGSTTEDLDNDECLHWPRVAQQLVNRAGRPDVRIYNGGMAGYTTAHTLVRFEMDVLQYEPDVVLIMHDVNDLSVVYHAWRRGRPVDANYLVQFGAATYTDDGGEIVLSRLLHSLRARLAEWTAARSPEPAGPYDLAGGRAIFERNLRSVVFVARGHGVMPVLLTMPACESESVYVHTLGQHGFDPLVWPREFRRFLLDFDAYNETIRKVGRDLGVPVIDLRREVPGTPANFVDAVHHSAQGVRAIGEVVARGLLALLPPVNGVRARPSRAASAE